MPKDPTKPSPVKRRPAVAASERLRKKRAIPRIGRVRSRKPGKRENSPRVGLCPMPRQSFSLESGVSQWIGVAEKNAASPGPRSREESERARWYGRKKDTRRSEAAPTATAARLQARRVADSSKKKRIAAKAAVGT